VANGLKFVAINNIPLEKSTHRFNVVKQAARTPQAVSSSTWAVACRNFPLTSWRGAVAARRPRRTSSCSPMRRRTSRAPFHDPWRVSRYQRYGISGAQLPAPSGAASVLSSIASRPARGNERVGPSWRCGLRYSARSTVEATRKADEHRPGKIIWPKFGAGSNIETPGVLPL